MAQGKNYARLRLATVDGVVSTGYKSGRKRWRETPDTASTAKTRSAGRPRMSQLDTVPCEPRSSRRASAVCPPTILQASNNASLLMRPINAQTVDTVNANSGSVAAENARMGKTAIFAPSAFWRRLDDALGQKWAPLNSNSLATRLGMSQGSVHRWYRGTGLPELSTAIDLAKEGGVCVDWLLNAVKPKHPISKDPVLRELFEICEDLHDDGRERVLRAAKGELLQQQGEAQDERQTRVGGVRGRAG